MDFNEEEFDSFIYEYVKLENLPYPILFDIHRKSNIRKIGRDKFTADRVAEINKFLSSKAFIVGTGSSTVFHTITELPVHFLFTRDGFLTLESA